MPLSDSTIRVTDLSGGMNIHHSKYKIASNQCVLLKNVTSDIFGAWKKRNGYTQVGDTLQSGKSITGLHSQILNDGTKRLLATVNNAGDTVGVLKYLNGSTWTTISGTSLVEDSKTEFTNWLNQVFIVGYDSTDGQYNTIKELSNLTVGTTNLTLAPNAKIAVEYLDKLYLANVQISGNQYPSYAAFCSTPTLAGDITWTPDITGMIGVGISDGDELTGAAVGYGQLLFYKNNGTYIFNENSLYKASNYGTSSYRSIRNIGQNVLAFHWGTDRKAITMYDGQGISVVADVIEPILNAVTYTNAVNAVAGTFEGHYYLYIGDITLPDEYAEYHKIPSTLTKVMVDLDFVHSTPTEPVVSIHSLAHTVTCMKEHNGDLYFGSTDGNVYKWASGDSDNGTPIEGIEQTNLIYGRGGLAAQYFPDEVDALKDFYKILIYMNESVTAQAMYSIDNENWQSLGDCNQKINVFTKSFGTGHGIRLKVTSYDSVGTSICDGFAITYKKKGVSK